MANFSVANSLTVVYNNALNSFDFQMIKIFLNFSRDKESGAPFSQWKCICASIKPTCLWKTCEIFTTRRFGNTSLSEGSRGFFFLRIKCVALSWDHMIFRLILLFLPVKLFDQTVNFFNDLCYTLGLSSSIILFREIFSEEQLKYWIIE